MTDEELYLEEWQETQIKIWQEKVKRLRVYATGHLYGSFSSQLRQTAVGSTIEMRFAQYGIYQALGVGKGYTHGNGGDLEFLDPEYRKEHKLDKPRKRGPAWGGGYTSGKPRKRRDWFSKKLYMSVMAMKEDLARIGGQHIAKVMCEAIDDARASLN